jgi:hypothetical protein
MDGSRTDPEICLDALRATRYTLSRYLDPRSRYSPTNALDAIIRLLESEEIRSALDRIDNQRDSRRLNYEFKSCSESQPHNVTSATLLRCTTCDVIRNLIESEPIAMRYELRTYECSVCKSVLRQVERTEPSLFPRI